ncbi:MAG TPA: cyanophycinase, partial [Gemmatales bacterium]|nr:cyanophycinase [Gemmatales bacterium]
MTIGRPGMILYSLVCAWLLTGIALCCSDDTQPTDLRHGLAASVTTPAPVAVEGIGPGALILQGGGKTPPAILETFLQLSGGEKPRLVVIPTASADAEKTETWLARWKEHPFAEVAVLHTLDRKLASTAAFVQPLRQATAVFITGGDQRRLSDAYAGTLVEEELQALLQRGGVIWGTSAGAAIQTKLMIAGGKPPEIRMAPGLALLPGCVVDQHFLARQREPRLRRALEQFPGFVGLGIDEATALVVQGRTLRVVGDSTVTVLLAKGAGRPWRKEVLAAKQTSDLTMLRRAALERAQPEPRTGPAGKPFVPVGSLMLVGGIRGRPLAPDLV